MNNTLLTPQALSYEYSRQLMEQTVMATPEGKVKQKVTKALKEIGAYYFYPVTSGFGTSGLPDVVACYQGRFFGIECKAGRNKPTALQAKNLSEILEAGGFSIVVNEDNVDNLLPLMVAWVNEERD